MAIKEELLEIERAVGFSYPASFIATFEEFSTLLGTDDFRHVFPGARLLLSAPEVMTARENIPETLLPFMREEQPSWPDIYAFEFNGDGPQVRVVVWSGHAIVMDWQNFAAFFHWVHEQLGKHVRVA